MKNDDKHVELVNRLREYASFTVGQSRIEALLNEAADALSAPSATVPAPDGHDDATARIEKLVREIEIICDHFGYDESQWLAEKSAVTETRPQEKS